MSPKAYVYITSSGYDPEKGKNLKDPYLGAIPTLGACMPNIRRLVVPGDQIFVISGKVPGVQQFVIGGFEVAEKINPMIAYRRFPDLRLHLNEQGNVEGNVILNSRRKQHHLDRHDSESFENRIKDYVVGRNPIALTAPQEIARGRRETMDVLRQVLRKPGVAPINVVGRWSKLEQIQALEIRDWLFTIKSGR